MQEQGGHVAQSGEAKATEDAHLDREWTGKGCMENEMK